MIDADPALTIRDLLTTEWDATNTSLADAPTINTGWFDYGNGDPQVTISNKNEFTIGGGDTGHSAGTGDGRAVQVRAGTLLVNGWSGTREELRGAAGDGSDINPKQMSFELGREIHRILQSNASDDAFQSLGADAVRGIPETDAADFVHRHEVTCKYTYIDRAEA